MGTHDSAKLAALLTDKHIWDWLHVQHPLAAGVHPNTTHVTGCHPLPIVIKSAALAGNDPVLDATCMQHKCGSARAAECALLTSR